MFAVARQTGDGKPANAATLRSDNAMSAMVIEIQRACSDAVFAPKNDAFNAWLQSATSLLEPSQQLEISKSELCIRLVDEEEIHQLNLEYRDKDKSTNVLSFPFESVPGIPDQHILGDIIICPAVVEREAKQQSKELKSHWAHMSIHGFLHLCGFDHIEEQDALLMEGLESNILTKLGFSSPW